MKGLAIFIVSVGLFGAVSVLDFTDPGSLTRVGLTQAKAYYGTGRRIARRTARRTARRVARRHNYYRAPAVYAPPVAAAGLAVGAIVASLPSSCSSVSVNGITYYNCGGTYYQPAYDGPNLVYVVVEPPR